MMLRALTAAALLAAVAVAQSSISSYDTAAAGMAFRTPPMNGAVVPALMVDPYVITVTSDRYVIGKMKAGAGTTADFSFKLPGSSTATPTSLFNITSTVFAVIANDTMWAFDTTATPVSSTPSWTWTVGWPLDLKPAQSQTYRAPLVWNSKIYVGIQNTTNTYTCTSDRQSTVYAVDVTTGTNTWMALMPYCFSNYVIAADASTSMLYARSNSGYSQGYVQIFQIDSSNGNVTGWATPLYSNSRADYRSPQFAVSGSYIYATAPQGGRLAVYALSNGTQVSGSSQTFSDCGRSDTQWAPVVRNGKVIVVCDNSVAVFGAMAPFTKAGDDDTYYSSSIRAWTMTPGGDVIVGNGQGELYTFTVATTTFSTRAWFDNPYYGSATEGFTWKDNNAFFVTFSSSYGTMFLVNYTNTTTPIYTNRLEGPPVGPVAYCPMTNNGEAYVSSSDTYSLTGYFAPSGPIMGSWASSVSTTNGLTYLNTTTQIVYTTSSSYFYAYDVMTGTRLWRSNTITCTPTNRGIVQVLNSVCVYCSSGRIVCTNALSGVVKSVSVGYAEDYWRLSPGPSVRDNKIFVSGTSTQYLIDVAAMEAATGTYTPKSVTVTGYKAAGWGTLPVIGDVVVTASSSGSLTSKRFSNGNNAWPPITSTSGRSFVSNVLVIGTDVYVAGSKSSGSGTTATLKYYVMRYDLTTGSHVADYETGISDVKFIMYANNAIYAFGQYTFTCLAPKGDVNYFVQKGSGRVQQIGMGSSYLYVDSDDGVLPSVTPNGVLSLITWDDTFVAMNGFNGSQLWNQSMQSSYTYMKNVPQQVAGGLVWMARYYVYVSNPMNGTMIGSFPTRDSSYRINSLVATNSTGNGDLMVVYSQNSRLVSGMVPLPALQSWGAPADQYATGGPFPAAENSWLETLKKNKLWIIGVVVAIVVVIVIVFLVCRARGGSTGSKDQDYVSMNNQRV